VDPIIVVAATGYHRFVFRNIENTSQDKTHPYGFELYKCHGLVCSIIVSQ
jgi:hypothetical protein